MSFFELLVVLVVCLFVVKPEDLPKIIKKIKEIRNFIHNTKQDIFSYFDSMYSVTDTVKKDNDLESAKEIKQINYYLKKMINLGIEYEGKYDLESVKDYYYQSINQIYKEKRKKKKEIKYKSHD